MGWKQCLSSTKNTRPFITKPELRNIRTKKNRQKICSLTNNKQQNVFGAESKFAAYLNRIEFKFDQINKPKPRVEQNLNVSFGLFIEGLIHWHLNWMK